MTTPDLQQTFQNRVEQHKKILYKVCNAYCRDRDSREDLAQEIMFQLWRSFGKFDGRCQFSTWMYRIALNVAISFYRSEGDSVHPCGKLAASIELSEGTPKLEHDFLRKVFPRVTVPAVGVADLIKNLLVLLNPVLKRLLEVWRRHPLSLLRSEEHT